LTDINKIKSSWKAQYEEKINSSVDSLWNLISHLQILIISSIL